MSCIGRTELLALIEQQLQSHLIRDYCPNGLQVEGKAEIRRIVAGVTASQALLDKAVELSADAVLVHHGYFWKNETPQITGMKKRRLQTLLRHDINLLAYHLPLDVHPVLGNNAQLAQKLGLTQWSAVAAVSPAGVLMQGTLTDAVPAAAIAHRLEQQLGRGVLHNAVLDRPVRTLAWCTGGGQSYIDAAYEAGADLFISGEVSEQTIHSSRELGIDFIAAGHHATERYGVAALADYIAAQTGISCQFIDIDNPA
ncbi:Nif3-like dinuclear metal center hexameric protein [Rheinheimera marina]|uniref:Nif3-like dinuclear metal center hexameric protein n=1 Tax=Rheinheimera marina TaxID=1774958 RepID=A0ABV9JQT9_9GAMM